MLERYTSGEMAAIWSDESRYARWRDVELAVLSAHVDAGDAPVEVLTEAQRVTTPSNAEIEAVEAEVRHDVVAFLDAWTGTMSDHAASHVHRHLTSSDVVDTAQAVAVAAATDLIIDAGRRLVVALADRAIEHRNTVCVARTHGQPAALDVFGHRLADFAFAVDRGVRRLAATRLAIAVAKISGPVGTGIGLAPQLVENAASSLGLRVAPVSTQVVFRDAVAAWVCDLAVLGATCEAVATDIRIWQHDGIAEVAEPRKPGQEGSSAMPHKRNPITAENITGLARVLRGYVGPALEDVALWGHRDISHSSVERVVLPDAAALCEHVLASTARAIEGAFIDRHAIAANLRRAGPELASHQGQVQAQQQGLRRKDAALVVRQRLADGDFNEADVDQAAAALAQSPVLDVLFSELSGLREQNLSPRNDNRA